MYGKLKITGKIELVTGLHIGASNSFSAIGAVDSPIVKDVRNGNPVIPGSSLKGKLRTLLAKKYNEAVAEPNEDNPKLTSLFGSSKKGHIKAGRLIFSDMTLANWEDMKKEGLTSKTEVKWENTISRSTAVATPRQIERAIILKEGFKILQYDYLGGSGTRGYGKVKFTDLSVCLVVGDSNELTETVNKCQEILDELGKQEDSSDNK